MSRDRLKFLLRCGISVVLVAVVLRKADWPAIGVILGRMDLSWAVGGSFATFGLIAALALRWRLFLRQQGIDIPYRRILSLTWAGQFFNSVLPGSTGGDVVKLVEICRLAPDRKAAAASTVFVDRLSALVALLLLAGVALMIDPAPLNSFLRASLPVTTIVFGGIVVGLVGIAGFWLGLRLLRKTEWHGRIVRTLAAGQSILRLSGTTVAAFLLALGVHLWNFFAFYLFARALQIPITYAQVLLMLPVILLVLLIPVTINGHGLREVLLIAYFGYMGVAVAYPGARVQEAAVALSLVAVANDLLWSVPGGLLYFFSRHSPRGAPEATTQGA